MGGKSAAAIAGILLAACIAGGATAHPQEQSDVLAGGETFILHASRYANSITVQRDGEAFTASDEAGLIPRSGPCKEVTPTTVLCEPVDPTTEVNVVGGGGDDVAFFDRSILGRIFGISGAGSDDFRADPEYAGDVYFYGAGGDDRL